jgi:hypothetical protein
MARVVAEGEEHDGREAKGESMFEIGNRMRSRWLGSLALTASFVFGCGGDDDKRDISGEDTAPLDGFEVDLREDTADTSEPEEVREPSPFLGPCRSNSECVTGWCVPTAAGTVCTQECGAGCPAGWTCGRVVNSPTDQVDLCLDRSTTLCHPCEEDNDCNLFTTTTPARCLGAGTAGGGFCGLACDTDVACPEGYECRNQSGEITDGAGQCAPVSGECTCNELAVGLRLSTACFVDNEVGTCDGVRQCSTSGLSVCSARAAVAETCNDVDDDCDGRTDEDLPVGPACDITNAFGTCPGQLFCVEGADQCLGTPPVAELCDGLDQNCNGQNDEVFPDQDRDQIADCVDPDIDGDGTPNGQDCAPLDPQRHLGATERCNGSDDDCDGTADNEGAVGCEDWYQDVDGDTFGSDTAPARCFCSAQAAIHYTVKNTSDCDDLLESVNPNGVEVCNGTNDNCAGGVDEGVQAPCGGCVPLCLLPVGQGNPTSFNLTGSNANNVSLNGAGQVRLATGQTSGWYRQRWSGWPAGSTEWSTLFADVELPTGTSVSFRWRSAASLGALDAAAFSAVSGPYPPASLPLFFVVTGRAFEIEVQLLSTSVGPTPLIKELEVLSKQL